MSINEYSDQKKLSKLIIANDRFRLIVTTRYSDFGSNVMTVYCLTAAVSIFDAPMTSAPTLNRTLVSIFMGKISSLK